MTEEIAPLPRSSSVERFDKDFVDKAARRYKLNPARLRAALDDAMTEYDASAPYSRRQRDWRAATHRYAAVHRKLESALAAWRKSSDRTRKTFTEFFLGAHTDKEFEKQLAALTDQLYEILDFAKLARGRPGRAASDREIDLDDFRGFAIAIDEFWQAERGTHLGHGFLAEFSDAKDDKRGKHSIGDAGLMFLHACLKVLEPHVTRRITSSLIRSLKPRAMKKKNA